MDWVATTADPNETLDGLAQSIRVLREPAAKLTQRTNKLVQPDEEGEGEARRRADALIGAWRSWRSNASVSSSPTQIAPQSPA